MASSRDRPAWDGRDSLATVGALALIAMCLVTFAHEAAGHGGACLGLGGRIQLLSSSLFHCDRASPLIDADGPVTNLLLGLAALAVRTLAPVRNTALRLFLILVTAFSLFWEGGYLVQAMATRDGDSYFAARDLLGAPELWWRMVLGVVGVAVYGGAVVVTARALATLWPDRARARRVARAAWLVALSGAAVAALFYQGPNPERGLHDALTEIGLAAVPLLLIPRGKGVAGEGAVEEGAARIAFNPVLLTLAVAIFALFAATMGRGLGV